MQQRSSVPMKQCMLISPGRQQKDLLKEMEQQPVEENLSSSSSDANRIVSCL